MTKKIFLSGEKGDGRYFLCDDDDFDLLSRHKWWLDEKADRPYTQISRKTTTPERLILGSAPEGKIWDHKDRNPYNNQRSNLREATQKQNMHNRSPSTGKSSKYKGVDFDQKKRRWRAQLKSDGRTLLIRHFETEDEAALAYNLKAKEVFGEYAYLNDVPEGTVIKTLRARQKENSSSKYIGVRKASNTTFSSRVVIGQKEVGLGCYTEELEAAKAREFVIHELRLDYELNNLDVSTFEPTAELLTRLEKCRKLLDSTEES